MEIGKPFPVSSLSSSKLGLQGLDKLMSRPGAQAVLPECGLPLTLTSPGNLTLDRSQYLAAQLGGHS